jgi:murein DD-endopeptidase MepM/ murein hydrolase activator NlpD
MAINTQKFLPSSKGGALSKVNNNIIKGSSSIGFTNKSVENLGIIRIKVIKIDDILKGTLAIQKKKLTEEKKKESSERREKIEEKLETKPNAEKGKIKMPSLPRMGFLDWVKNFIGNIILGYFAVRLVDHLPKIIPIVKFLGKATDFVLGVGGKLLDGLVTFIDWGYKAYDATRGFVKNLFGDDGVKQFDQLSGTLNQFLNLALIAGMTVAGSGGFGGGKGRGTAVRPGGKPKVTTSGGRTVGRPDVRNPFRQRPKVTVGRGGNRALLSSVRPFLKRIPLPLVGALIDFGLSVALGENPGRAAFRAIGAGLLGAVGAAAGTVVPVAGNFIGGLLGGAAGDAIGGVLYDFLFGGKTSSAKGKITKKAGGGITRAGRPQRGVRRTLTRKAKYKRKLAPKKPGDVEATSPGSDVGGEEKLFGLFPNPFKMMQKAADVMNPFKVIQKAGKNLGESDYFGPILAITSKILLGQKPTQEDYKNVGLGINMLVAKGIDDGKLKGGLVAAFAEGGFVDPKALNAISQGGDISDWVAKSFKEATETNAQKTLREIQENLRLKPTSKPQELDPTLPVDDDMLPGVTAGQWGPLLDLIASVESGNSYEALNPSTTLPGATKMTISRVAAEAERIGKSKGGTGAVGRYQQLPWYLISRAKAAGLNPDKDLFSPKNQDLIVSKVNIEQNRSGRRWLKGEISDEQFMQGLSQEFAAIPNARGVFYYSKQKSSMTPQKVKDALGKVKRGGYSQQELSAAQGSVGTVNQQGLPPLPPTGTLRGQNYGDPREGGRKHAGQDYDASSNGTFYSRIGGEVKYIGNNPGGYYKFVDIYNPQLGVTERIAEGDNILVKLGQKVSKGTAVASGTSNTGVFHYEIRRGSGTTYGFEGTIDPKKFLTGTSRFHGGPVTKTGQLFAHKGEYVIDKDSVDLFGMNFIDSINRVENQSDLIAKAPSIIEKLKLISGYASYETEAQETIVVTIPPQMNVSDYGTDETYGGSVYVDGDNTDPFETLYQGG